MPPEPWAKFAGKFCPPRTTSAALGSGVIDNLSTYWPASPGYGSVVSLLAETIPQYMALYQVPSDSVAERRYPWYGDRIACACAVMGVLRGRIGGESPCALYCGVVSAGCGRRAVDPPRYAPYFQGPPCMYHRCGRQPA